MDPEAEVLAVAALAGAAPVIAGVAGAAPAVAINPIHEVLRTCGVALLAARMTFINVSSSR